MYQDECLLLVQLSRRHVVAQVADLQLLIPPFRQEGNAGRPH